MEKYKAHILLNKYYSWGEQSSMFRYMFLELQAVPIVPLKVQEDLIGGMQI